MIRSATGAVPTTNDVALRAARGTLTEHCSDWTATAGNLRMARPASIRAAAFQGEDPNQTAVCGNAYRLLCFER